jgi:cytochrome c5
LRRGGVFAAALAVLLLFVAGLDPAAAAPRKKRREKAPAPADFDVKLPVLGTQLAELPPGPGRDTADQSCMQCHSASMLLQQRLTAKQWTASLEKMMRWGAVVPADRKDALLAYLAEHFGPDNDRFEPLPTRPVGR